MKEQERAYVIGFVLSLCQILMEDDWGHIMDTGFSWR